VSVRKMLQFQDGHETTLQQIGARNHTERRDRYQSKG